MIENERKQYNIVYVILDNVVFLHAWKQYGTRHDGLFIKNDELFIKSDGLFINNDRFVLDRMDFVLKGWILP